MANEIKDTEILQVLRPKIKYWVPLDCPCRLFKTYLLQVEFIEAIEAADIYKLFQLRWGQLAFHLQHIKFYLPLFHYDLYRRYDEKM